MNKPEFWIIVLDPETKKPIAERSTTDINEVGQLTNELKNIYEQKDENQNQESDKDDLKSN